MTRHLLPVMSTGAKRSGEISCSVVIQPGEFGAIKGSWIL